MIWQRAFAHQDDVKGFSQVYGGYVNHRQSDVQNFVNDRISPYPDYKASGIEWLGQIPTHWEVKRLKHLASFFTGWTPPTGQENLYSGEHFWVNISDLGPKVIRKTEKTISDEAIREARLKGVSPGSLLFSFKLSIGIVSIAGAKMYTNEAIAAFLPSNRIHTGYLYWAAPIFIPANAQVNIYGARLLNKERIENALLIGIPIAEQRAIAAFLDRETARIDALVAKKQRLIELLQEKRAALISHAVTQGLDPNVSTKDSGVDWLGKIPAHWEVNQLSHVIRRFVDYRGKTPAKAVSGVPLVTAKNIKNQVIDYSASREYIPEELYSQWMIRGLPDFGDVVITTEAPLGETAVITNTNVALAQRVILLKANMKKISNEYLKYHFVGHFGFSELQTRATGSTAIGIKASHLKASLITIPTIREQIAIANFLDREIAKIDALVAKVREAIDRLKELRQALISAVVTGKIDVSNFL